MRLIAWDQLRVAVRPSVQCAGKYIYAKASVTFGILPTVEIGQTMNSELRTRKDVRNIDLPSIRNYHVSMANEKEWK